MVLSGKSYPVEIPETSISYLPQVEKLIGRKQGNANYILEVMKKLYKIEEEIKEKSIGERQQVRQEQSEPILKEIKNWLDEKTNKYLPKNRISTGAQADGRR